MLRDRWRTRQHSRHAFTLVELLIVIAIIAILAALSFPVFSAAEAKVRETACLNNLKQLEACSLVYMDDNGSKFVDNTPLAYLPPGASNNWVLGDMTITTQATNTMLLRYGELFPYTTQIALYHCPGDRSQVQGTPRVRSYSMNCWMGSSYMTTGFGTTNAVAPEPGYRTFVTGSQMAILGTSSLWTIADENEVTIGDPWWLVTMDNSDPFASFPATRHSRGYNLSFADGHVERWNLLDRNTVSPSVPVVSGNSDWVKLKQASTIAH